MVKNREGVLNRGNSKNKGTEVVLCLGCSDKSKKPSMKWSGRIEGNEAREVMGADITRPCKSL